MNISGLSGLMGQMQSQMFKTADADGNGGLSKAEFQNMTDEMKANAPAGMQHNGPTSLDDAFTKADTDGNGELSLDEMKTGMQANMPKMDGNSFMAMMNFSQEDDNTYSNLSSSNETTHSTDLMSGLIQQLLANYKTDKSQEKHNDNSGYNQNQDTQTGQTHQISHVA